MKNKRKIKKFPITIIFLSLIGLVYSESKIIKWHYATTDNEKIQESIQASVIIESTYEELAEESPQYTIDWDKLKAQNSDTIAYLKVGNTNIDYVIVKGSNNSYYLNHNFNKESNIAGWPFADYHNKFDGTDKNIIIYGHNTQDNSMFGSLKNILTEAWYNNEENLVVDLVTENGFNQYQIFSIYTIIREDYYINTNFKSNEEYLKFLNTLKKRSIKKFDIDLNEDDQILTLSTCLTGGIKRIVLHAKLLK